MNIFKTSYRHLLSATASFGNAFYLSSEVESDVIGSLVDINANIEVIVFCKLNLIEKSLHFRYSCFHRSSFQKGLNLRFACYTIDG